MFTALTRSAHSEWILLDRPRLWYSVLPLAAVLAVGATWLVTAAAGDGPRGIAAVDGATSAVMSATGFVALLVAAAFAAPAGTQIDRGLTRAALTRQPRRIALETGKLTSRLGVAAITAVTALAAGAVTARVVAPHYGYSTAGWFGADGAGDIASDAARLGLFILMYAAIGTTLAVMIRSTPITLAVLLLWFGPIENVIGEGRDWAQRWFPGLVMRSLVNPGAPDSLSTPTVLWTSAIYLTVCAVVAGVVLARRDVTN